MKLQLHPNRKPESRRRRAALLLPCQEIQKGPIALVGWVTVRTMAQMSRNRCSLFRPELVIKIFPQPEQDFLTIHAPYPFATSPPADGWKKNSRGGHLVPGELESALIGAQE